MNWRVHWVTLWKTIDKVEKFVSCRKVELMYSYHALDTFYYNILFTVKNRSTSNEGIEKRRAKECPLHIYEGDSHFFLCYVCRLLLLVINVS